MRMNLNRIAVLACLLGFAGYTIAKDEPKKERKPLDRQEIIKKYDKDGDGKLNDEEKQNALKEFRKGRPDQPNKEELLKKYDANKNGQLDPEEKEKARKELGARAGRSREELLKKFDKDGDGKLSDAEREAARKETRKGASVPPDVLKKYDADKDGKLSREEMRKAREDGAIRKRPGQQSSLTIDALYRFAAVRETRFYRPEEIS